MRTLDLVFIWIAGIWSLIVLLIPPLNFVRGGQWYREAPIRAENRLIDEILEEQGIEKILEMDKRAEESLASLPEETRRKLEDVLATLPKASAEEMDRRNRALSDPKQKARDVAKVMVTKEDIEKARKTYFRPNPASIWNELFAVWIPLFLLWLTIRWRSTRKNLPTD